MAKVFSFFLFSLCLAGNPVHDWIESHTNVLNREIKTVSFKISFQNEMTGNSNTESKKGKITVALDRKFRFEMGPRTVISTGEIWKSYDQRTNQIFINDPDKKFEDLILSWMDIERLKSAVVESRIDGGFRLDLGGSENEILIYFANNQKSLSSVVINNRKIKTVITDIILTENKMIDLSIGQDDSMEFDLRGQ